MKLPFHKYPMGYLMFHRFLSPERLKENNNLRLLLITTVITSTIIMWAYALIALFVFPNPLAGIIGIMCCLIHLLSSYFLKFINRPVLVGNILLFVILVHQTTFSFFTGGFTSTTLILSGLLPLYAGFVNGKKGTLTWFSISISVALIMLVAELNGFKFPENNSANVRLLSQIIVVFGYIFLSTSVMIMIDILRNTAEEVKLAQAKKIDDLVKVLFHDLANPLGRISIGINLAKKNEDAELTKQGLEIASQASEAMVEITQNVRKMYAISKGKAQLDVSPFPFLESIEHSKQVCTTELENKRIKIDYDSESLKNLYIVAEAVSFKNQVLCNIISNAIKFSPAGRSITISASEASKGFIFIEIKDQGVGMPSHILENLFEINQRTTRKGTMGESGTGLGMHIMKSYVELYDGHVEVISTEKTPNSESGTLFKLKLKGYWVK